MLSTDAILEAKKPETLRRYLRKVGAVEIPPDVKIPKDPREALMLGMSLARKSAYEDGLVDGAELGVEVVLTSIAFEEATPPKDLS